MGFSGLECFRKPTLPEKPYFFSLDLAKVLKWSFIFNKCLPKIDDEQRNLLTIWAIPKIFKTDISNAEWYLIWSACIRNWEKLDEEFRVQFLNQGLSWLKNKNDRNTLSVMFERRSRFVLEDKDSLNLIINWIELNSTSLQAISLAVRLLTVNKKYLSEQEVSRLTSWMKMKLFKNDVGSTEWYLIWKICMEKWEQLDEELQVETLSQSVNLLKTQNDSDSLLLVFKDCLSYMLNAGDYINLIIDWIEVDPSSKNALMMALILAKDYQDYIPAKSINRFRLWAKARVMKTDIGSVEWYLAWEAYWELMPTLETATLALKWMEFNPKNILDAESIVLKLIALGREDVSRLIAKWYEKHPEHPVGKTILKYLELTNGDLHGQCSFS
jgi:hypothetical protein